MNCCITTQKLYWNMHTKLIISLDKIVHNNFEMLAIFERFFQNETLSTS